MSEDETPDLFSYNGNGNKTRADQIFARFKIFHRANPQIWKLYQKFAFQVMEAGASHYSSNAIFQRIRWHVEIETRSADSLKLNDHYHCYYSRMFAAVYPEHDVFFRYRKRITSEKPAYKTDVAVFHTGAAEDESTLMDTLRDLADESDDLT